MSKVIRIVQKETGIKGDANGDGSVDVADIANVISIMAAQARR